MLLWLTIANAQEPMPPRPTDTVPEPTPRVALRVVTEAWDDPSLASVYRSGFIAPGIAANLPLTGPLSLDVEGAYRRVKPREESPDAAFELVPLTVAAEVALVRRPGWTGFVGGGPALVVFSERHPENTTLTESGADVVRGTRMGLDLRAGTRIDTGLFGGPRVPGERGLRGLDIEVIGARRFTRPGLAGLQLGAWRLSLGVAFRL